MRPKIAVAVFVASVLAAAAVLLLPKPAPAPGAIDASRAADQAPDTSAAKTAVPAVPLGCAICAFIYYNAQGIRKKGLTHYAAHFLGPSDPSMSLFIRIPLAILMLPIEIVSHLARVLSLTIRLWANMFAGDLVTMAFFSMISVGVPVLFLALHLGVSFLQTYIFVLLTMVYLAGAAAEEH